MLGKKSYTVIDQNVPTAQQGGNSLIWSTVESSSQFSSTHKVSRHGGGGGGSGAGGWWGGWILALTQYPGDGCF